MKPPGITAYLFGNLASFIAAILIGLYVGYLALSGQGSGWLVIIMLVTVAYCAASNRRITAYATWKAEWNAMNGNGRPARQPRPRWLRFALGIPAWLFGAYLALSNTDPSLGWAVAMFWLVSVFGFGNLFWQMARNAKRRAPQSEGVVAICVGIPMRSVSITDSREALPDFCSRLLR